MTTSADFWLFTVASKEGLSEEIFWEAQQSTEVGMDKKKKFSFMGLIGHSVFFMLVYALLFFTVSNLLYWYFHNHEFLYKELLTDSSYSMFAWVENAVNTIAIAGCVLVIEIIRYIFRR